jgi:23S rRNA (cytidine1920-2'-O)/16S rRNA (cytidine1409-2'-O)-methyltransferase
MSGNRLDAALAARGLARSRTQAAALIAEGRVTIDGAPVRRAATRVTDDSRIEVAGADHYVSRAAHKLIEALDCFGVDPAGRLALDVGASTGGFTQVLLERGAERVIALDVGHGQLAIEIADDDRVAVIEGVNARYLTRESLETASGVERSPDLVVGDLSFISLTTVLPALVAVAADGADFVLLIKPQFEVGRTGIREGVVRDARLREDAVAQVAWAAWDLGLGTAGLCPSPIAGSHGNREYLIHLNAANGAHPTEWLQRITRMVGA